MGTAGKGEEESSYLPASVCDKVSSGFSKNPAMLALLPPLHRRCSSPGVREERAGRGGWLCSSRCVFSCAVHTIGCTRASYCHTPVVYGSVFLPTPRFLGLLVLSLSLRSLCLSVFTTATGLVSCPTFPQHGEVRE